MHRGSIPSTAPFSPTAPDSPDAVDDFELIGDDLDSLLDSVPNGQDDTEVPVSFFFIFNLQTRPESKLLY